MEPAAGDPAARAFLDALWTGKPAAAAIQIWDKRTKLTSTFDTTEAAATFATETGQRGDVYVAAGLALKVARPSRTRAKKHEVIGIAGAHADIDINGGPENKKGAAPDMDTALELAHELLVPTLILNSGHGIQPWWLLDEPWIFNTDTEQQREQAQRLVEGFQRSLMAAAERRGFKIDSTYDLARLMRVPGTLNFKGDPPQHVTLTDHEGPTHDPEVLHRVADMRHVSKATREITGDVDISLNGSAPNPDMDKIMGLMAIEPAFAAAWVRSAKLGDGSPSGYDMVLANHMVAAEFTDQEILEALRWGRHKHHPGDEKNDRIDYYQMTIAKARAGRPAPTPQSAELREHDQTEALREAQQADNAPEGAVSHTLALSIINRALGCSGAYEIKGLVEDSADFVTGRFTLELADGREVNLGAIRNLSRQEDFREHFGAVTQHWPLKVEKRKDQTTTWDTIVRLLLKHAKVIERPEDAAENIAIGWVIGYTRDRIYERQQALALMAPFRKDGYVYVHRDELGTWVRTERGERSTDADVRAYLSAAGFENVTENFYPDPADHSKRKQHRYWRIAEERLDRFEEG